MLTITSLYAGLTALFYVFLSVRVINRRVTAKVSTGDGEDKELFTRIRVQGNCAEYAPMGLLLMALADAQGAPGWLMHLLGLMLLAGRLLHAWGLGATPQRSSARIAGMALTFAMLIAGALVNLRIALF
ncbi:MAPEG family protein [Actibacterium sp. D379-3]